jgi:putative acetyltransferase
MIIRTEYMTDQEAIRNIHAQAFGQMDEACLVDRLRKEKEESIVLSLVGESKGSVLGHALFCKIDLKNKEIELKAAALAPIGVLPDSQNEGLGKALIEEGLLRLKKLGYQVVLVLGDPTYYERFGFSKELAKRIKCEYSCDAFMALELETESLPKEGTIKATYPSAFEYI